MAGKFYAWTNFDIERNEWGQTTNVIHVGDTITQAQLDVSDEQWEELIATGAVREEEYPEVPDGVSPAEFERNQASVEAAVQELQMNAATAGKTMEEIAAADAEAAESAPAPAASTSTKATAAKTE